MTTGSMRKRTNITAIMMNSDAIAPAPVLTHQLPRFSKVETERCESCCLANNFSLTKSIATLECVLCVKGSVAAERRRVSRIHELRVLRDKSRGAALTVDRTPAGKHLGRLLPGANHTSQ